MKKAGTIVGVLIILVALGIYMLAKHSGGGAVGVTNSTAPSSVTFTTASKKTTAPKTTSSHSQHSQSHQTTTSTSSVSSIQKESQPTHVFSSLSPSNLGSPVGTNTEIMVVADKKVVVLDSAYGTNKGKQLAYAVDLLYSKGKMTLFVSGDTFSTLKVGSKLKVKYDIYKNSSGVTFPVIMNVTSSS